MLHTSNSKKNVLDPRQLLHPSSCSHSPLYWHKWCVLRDYRAWLDWHREGEVSPVMTYHPDTSCRFPDPGYLNPNPAVTICSCGKTWYQGEACDKKLTWAGKFYCRFCYKKAHSEKVSILKALPYEVVRIMVDRGDLRNERISKFVWDFWVFTFLIVHQFCNQ